jgi:CBS domain containing-hemolysin-like protein
MSDKADSDDRGEAESFWQRITGFFSSGRDASLRKSLEDVIEQHDGPSDEALVKSEAKSMMLNLLRFPDLRVDDVMVPRADIIAIEDDATVNELLDVFSEANHSRIPVFRNTLDDPQGMIHIKDLMHWLTAGEKSGRAKKPAAGKKPSGKSKKRPIGHSPDRETKITDTTMIREVLFVPPSMPATDLLVKMQSSHIHLAIVVDEYGGTDGLVSIEDVVEEIVGDIADEHDDDTDLITKTSSGNYVADARAPIEDVEKVLNIDLLPDEQDEDADTLGGFVFSMLGRVPVRGELVRHSSGIEFEIMQADARRVKRLKIHVNPDRKNSQPNNG